MRLTAMPQRIALSHAFGALDRMTVVALGFEVSFGGVTVTGSLMALASYRKFCGADL
jgi:hypothetical protein